MATNLDLSVRQLINSEVTAWRIISLNNLTEVSHFLTRNPSQITSNDRLLRDVYFANQLSIPSNPTEPSFVQYAKDAYQQGKTKQFAFQKKMEEDRYIKRGLFWKHIFWLNSKTKQQSESKKIVRKTAFLLSLIPVTGFLAVALILFKVSGISKLSSKVKRKGLIIFTLGGLYWTYSRLSDNIFKNIPSLPDKKLQIQRKHLLAESTVTEGLFMEPMQNFESTLQKAGSISTNNEQIGLKKILIQNEGFRVFQ